MRSPIRRGVGRDRGTASIEMVALVPLVLTVLVFALQVLMMAYTAHGASQAARDAARAYSLNQSPEAAAAASLPGAVSLVSVTTFGPDHGVRVTVEAPPMLLLTDRQVSRSVTFP
jgi:Flp pilus assembly protein TadG